MDRLSPENNDEAESPLDIVDAQAEYLTLATSPATDTLLRGLTDGVHLLENDRQIQSSNSGSYTVTALEDSPATRRLTYKGSAGTVTLEFQNMELIDGSNVGARKLFNLIFTKIGSAIRDGKPIKEYIPFTLHELVALQMYKTEHAAYNGVKRSARILTSIKIEGELRHGNGKAKQAELIVLFYRIKTGAVCKAYLSPGLDWNLLVQYTTILPGYALSLHSKAEALCEYVFSLARQNIIRLRQEGSFTISMRAIQHRLCLPDIGQTRYPGRDIRGAIDGAIWEINREHRATFDNTELLLSQEHVDDRNNDLEGCNSVEEYLDKGQLRVSMSGKLFKELKDVSGGVATKALAG